MRLSSLVYWYLSFSKLWVMAVFLFYSVLYSSLLFRPYPCGVASYWECVALVVRSPLEYALLFLSAVVVASILWGYEAEAGYHYLTHHGDYRGFLVFLSKVMAGLAFIVVPYTAAKALALLVAGYPGLSGTFTGYLSVVARLAIYSALYGLAGLSLAGFTASLARRTSHVIVAWALALVLLEPPGALGPGYIGLKGLSSLLYSSLVQGALPVQLGLDPARVSAIYAPLALAAVVEAVRDKG